MIYERRVILERQDVLSEKIYHKGWVPQVIALRFNVCAHQENYGWKW